MCARLRWLQIYFSDSPSGGPNGPSSASSFQGAFAGSDFISATFGSWEVHVPHAVRGFATTASSGPVLGGGLPGPTAAYPTFTWADLSSRPPPMTMYINGLPTTWQDWPPSFNLWMMSVQVIGYLLVGWYLGQVFTGKTGGFAQPFYFPFSLHYYGCLSPPATVERGDTVAELQRRSAVEGSVRIHRMSKAYGEKQALTEVSLLLTPGQCCALLGANGSGKSSLIGILSGNTAPTHGEAFVFGLSVRSDMPALRDRIGICPQDDLLWEGKQADKLSHQTNPAACTLAVVVYAVKLTYADAELTARQHLFLMASFKGVPSADIAAHVDERLRLVQLTDVAGNAPTSSQRRSHLLQLNTSLPYRTSSLDFADHYVTTFSGGMKRRLSLAISSCGYPQVSISCLPPLFPCLFKRRAIHLRRPTSFAEPRLFFSCYSLMSQPRD
jgi:hypothetical protein